MATDPSAVEHLSLLLKALYDLGQLPREEGNPDTAIDFVERWKEWTIYNPDLDPQYNELFQEALLMDTSPLLLELHSTNYPSNLVRASIAEHDALDPLSVIYCNFGPLAISSDEYEFITYQINHSKRKKWAGLLQSKWQDAFLPIYNKNFILDRICSHVLESAGHPDQKGIQKDLNSLLDKRLEFYNDSLLKILDQLIIGNHTNLNKVVRSYDSPNKYLECLEHLIFHFETALNSPSLQINLFPYLIWQGKQFGNTKEQSDSYAHNMLRIFEKYWAMLSDNAVPGENTRDQLSEDHHKTKRDNPFLEMFRKEQHAQIFVDCIENELGLTSDNGTKWKGKQNTFLGLRDILYNLHVQNKNLLLNSDYDSRANIALLLKNIYNKNLSDRTVKNPLSKGSERIKEMFPKDFKKRFL